MHSNTHNFLFLVCLPFLLNSLHAVWSEETDSLVLSSGTVGTDIDGRHWDADSKYLDAENSVISTAAFQDPSLSDVIPYMTARIFPSEATYKFPVKLYKRYWLRLHFYPSAYGNFNPVDSYFSVLANGLTLLKNFSASITCQAISQAYLVREYSLAPLESDILTVVFSPSDKHAGAFAFVNGIEVIRMPDLFDAATVVGSPEEFDVMNLTTETMYRLNVGGQTISPANDSGLSRAWYDDLPYIPYAALGITTSASPEIKIEYQGMPEYMAPENMYRTSRSMGAVNSITQSFNLTWEFKVDPKFMYLVRLHFCDYYNTEPNQLVFSIFINNQTAEEMADVIEWSGGTAVPTYKDYATYVNEIGWGDHDQTVPTLSVDLHPSDATRPQFLDALLNGLEIFKLADSAGNLAAPNPHPSPVPVF